MSRNKLLLVLLGTGLLAGCAADYLHNYDTMTLASGDTQNCQSAAADGRSLQSSFEQHEDRRRWRAVCWGHPEVQDSANSAGNDNKHDG
ncbi:hypothetical protein ACVOMV_18865 [Mesorhizobium atlanticum]